MRGAFVFSSAHFGRCVPSALQELRENDLYDFGVSIESDVVRNSIGLEGRVWRMETGFEAISHRLKGEGGCKVAAVVAHTRTENDAGLIRKRRLKDLRQYK